MVRIGERVPDFEARTSNGIIHFPDDLRGKWVILYSYIGSFLPTDTTDIQALERIRPKLKAYNTEVLGISPDSVASTLAWVLSMKNLSVTGEAVGIELISDRSLEISKDYGFNTTSQDMSQNEKAVYIIDSDGILRAKIFYPFSTGINVTELERTVLALKTGDAQKGQTPSGWVPGEDLLEHPPLTAGTAQTNIRDRESVGMRCVDWYLCFKDDTGQR